jgi:F420H(2)-dependent quinone reductase
VIAAAKSLVNGTTDIPRIEYRLPVSLRRESPIRGRRPAWSTNLLAHPECTVEFMGPPTLHRAELLSGNARALAWTKITDFYAGYERYQASCAPREIRVFRLRPIAY